MPGNLNKIVHSWIRLLGCAVIFWASKTKPNLRCMYHPAKLPHELPQGHQRRMAEGGPATKVPFQKYTNWVLHTLCRMQCNPTPHWLHATQRYSTPRPALRISPALCARCCKCAMYLCFHNLCTLHSARTFYSAHCAVRNVHCICNLHLTCLQLAILSFFFALYILYSVQTLQNTFLRQQATTLCAQCGKNYGMEASILLAIYGHCMSTIKFSSLPIT